MGVKYNKYPEYKDSEVEWLGETPSHWSIIRFKMLFRIRKRLAGKLGYPVFSITQKGIKVKDITSGEGQLSMDYSKYQLVYPGDFAMNQMDLLTGAADIAKQVGVTSPDYRVFTLENTNCYDRYFLHLLQLCYISRIFYPLGQGAAQIGRWRLPANAFNQFLATVPPHPEQIQIAKFLDFETGKIDRLIEKQQELIALLKEKRQAVISHAVTKGLNPNAPMKPSGIEWLGDVPEHWDVRRLKTLCNKGGDQGIQIGPFGGMLTNLQYGDAGEAKVYGQENVLQNDFTIGGRWITEARLEILEKYRPRFGDILFTRKGSIGGCSVFPDNAERGIIDSDTIRLRVDGDLIDTNYLVTTFREANYLEVQIQLMKRGAILSGLNTEIIENLVFTVPPINEQKEIYKQLFVNIQKFETLNSQAETQITLLQERRTALISAAVTGKIDVRQWEPPSATNGHHVQMK